MTSFLAFPGSESAPVHAVTQAAAGGLETNAWLLVALPLLGAAVLLLGGRRTNRWGHWFGVLMSASAFGYGLALLVGLLGYAPADRSRSLHLYSWIPVGDLKVDLGLLLDPLSLTFVMLITGVGTLIHVYSVSYMEHDENRRRFFAYLNLFLASMLLLVLADNYLALYVGWEGVGLASYLLIGFWQHKPSAAAAAKKAFVLNRVGDFGLAVAVMIMFATFGSVAYADVFAAAGKADDTALTLIGLALLLGACAKSAQLPLQAWLLDAMEGPTPVSALIHAATMVTAGVYLVTRSHALYELAPTAQLAVVIVGALTLLFGALIGTAKDDIKKALAASTMSQIGYMMLAAGLGPAGYAFAIMHLVTHGFFKAGMFLGSGSVMHAMNDEVDMRRYGALRKIMPVTFATFGLGYLAIIGVPPFAGFYSKDGIIEAAFGAGGTRGLVLGTATLVGAGITAFYMTRVMLMTFAGEKRWAEDAHPHESPKLMTVPLVILAFGSVLSGALFTYGGFAGWLAPVVGSAGHPHLPMPVWALTTITLTVVAAGVGVAWAKYGKKPVPAVAPARVSVFTRAARRDLFGDDFNELVVVEPTQELTRVLVKTDNRLVDGAVDGLASLVAKLSSGLRRVQNGYVRSYALSMLSGAALVVAAMLLIRL